jgi:hypothetical protein
VTFDVRTRQSRWHEKSFDAWRTILTKSPKQRTKISIIRGTTICVEARAHGEGQTSPWSEPECTATPVDDVTMHATGHWNRGDAPAYYAGTFSGAGRAGVELHLDDALFGILAVLMGKCPACGRFSVLIDGKRAAVIDTHASKDLGGVLVNVDVPGNGVGRHDVTIHVIDPGKRGVYIDALGVLRA